MTDKEINRAAFKYAGIRVVGVLMVLGINTIAVIHGYDLRTWEWWVTVPVMCLLIGKGVAVLETK